MNPDLDLDPSSQPEDQGIGDPGDFILAQRKRAMANALTSLDDSPEDAARAQELSEATGASPALVYGNLENFEQQHKAALTAHLLKNNQFLAEYADSHPLAAKVSSDDWGQMDTISNLVQKLHQGPLGAPSTAMSAAVKGFQEGFGQEPMGQWLPTDPSINRLAWSEMTAIGYPLEFAGRVFSGLMEGLRQGSTQAQIAFGSDANQAEQRANELAGMVEAQMMTMTGYHPPEVIEPLVRKVGQAGQAVKPYLDAGVELPVGVHEVIDQLHSEQAKQDVKQLDEIFKESQASATRERAPELFADFIRQHTDSRIGIDAGEVRRLYGDKVPEADDNILGWVPNIQEQLALAEAHGGDVEVPLADWLAKADPEVAKELHDFIRVRPGGMTLEETKEAGKPVELEEPAPAIKQEEEPEKISSAAIRVGDKIYRGTTHGEAAIAAEKDLGKEIDSSIESDLSGFMTTKGRYVDREEANRIAAAADQVSPVGNKLISEFIRGNYAAVETLRKSAGLEPLFGRPSKLEEAEPEKFGIVPESLKPEADIYDLDGFELSPYANFPLREGLKKIDPTGLDDTTKAMHAFFSHRLNELVGDVPVRVVPHEEMSRYGKEVHGFSTAGVYTHKTHEIFVSDDVVGGGYGYQAAVQLLLHEGEHALTHNVIESHPEIKADVRALMDDALTKSGLSEKEYGFTDEHEFMSEAATNPDFLRDLHATPISPLVAAKIGLAPATKRNLFDGFRLILKKIFARAFKVPLSEIPESILDGFLHVQEKIEKILKEGKPEGVESARQGAPAKGPEDAERDLFTKANAIGMTKDQYSRYMDLISKRAAEDLAHQVEQGKAIERERQTKEWKDNFARVREEVKADIQNRPDIAADRLLREGDLHGQKVRQAALDGDALTPEQKASLPKEYYRSGGVSPDTVAGLFGYQSGDSLVSALARLKQERELEGLTPAAHLSKLVDAETERKMRKEYGNLEENILADAKDHVISQTQMDLLHEEMFALGQQSGGELPLSKEDIKQGIDEQFNKVPVGSHSTDKYLADAGRAGRKAEQALLEGNPGDAFKFKQQQYKSILLADKAKKLEKKEASFDSKVKNWQKREPTGMNQEDAVWLHQILNQIGKPARRSIQDLDRQKELVSPYKNLREYVEGSNKVHGTYNEDVDAIPPAQQLNVADFLFSDNYRKTIDEMTPQEFEDVFNSLKSIDHYSRDTKRYTVKGNKVAINDVVSGLVARLKAAVDNKAITDEARQKQSAGRLVGTWLLNPETWMNRLDLGNRMGPFNQLIIRPIVEGQYLLKTYERSFAKQWKELGDFSDLTKKIDNPLFRDPETGDPIQLRKENAYAILQNMGNALQRQKLVLGWRVSKDVEEGTQRIWNWLASVGITKDDLARAQKMGDMFDKAFSLSETAYTHVAGVAPERIELKTVQTPWGEAKEWYHPLIPDPLRHSSKLNIDDMMGDSGYWRPSPASGYTKGRTGALYPIDLTFDSVPFKLKQILNDAAMRIPITEVSKIVYHNDFKAAFKKYYGVEYASALDGWMKDVAGNRQWVPSNMKALDQAVTTIQQNLSTLLIGWNLGTVGKHAPTAGIFSAAEVGTARFAKSLSKIIYELPGSRETWSFVHENSEEVRNRMRSLEDTLIAQNREMFKKVGWKGKVASFRDSVEWYGHAPVAFTDLISAVAMWHAEYGRLAEEKPELSHGDLVYAADTAVRRTHGSSILSNRPGIMRYNSPFARLIVPFYNFMSNALQRNYELAWKSKLATQGRELPEMTGFEKEQFEAGPQHIKSIIGGVMVYGVMVSLIEQMVDPLPDNKENRALHYAKILTRGYPSMIPGVRDAINYLYEGHDPSLGLYGTFARNVDKAIDPKSYTHDPGKTFRTLNTLFGTLTGLTFEPLGRVGQFAFNVAAGHEHPKGMGDLFKGMYRGTLKEPRR